MTRLRERILWAMVVCVTGLLLAAGARVWLGVGTATDAMSSECTHEEAQPSQAPLFRDVTAESGIDFGYRNGEEAGHLAILEALGGGLAVLDFDGDGLLDLFIVGGGYFDGPDKKEIKGRPCKLYRNLGNFKFEDVTEKVGLDKLAGGRPWFYSHGAAVCDYDRDGWPDLLVTGWEGLALFHNEPVDPNDPSRGRKFVEVADQAGLPQGLWTTGAGWGDLDG